MELALQDQKALREENAVLWQEMAVARRSGEVLTSKLSQVFSWLQHFANSFTNARPSKIVGQSGQQLIECQDDAGDADANLSTPQKRAR